MRPISRANLSRHDDDYVDDTFLQNVCEECEGRANRAFWISILLFFGIPLLIALPFILKSGTDSHAGSITVL